VVIYILYFVIYSNNSFTNIFYVYYFFFFSSRRRHTRSKRDWSSDVCSSDLLFCYKVASSRQLCFLLSLILPANSRSFGWLSNQGRIPTKQKSISMLSESDCQHQFAPAVFH